jgi:group I intron endonuclease
MIGIYKITNPIGQIYIGQSKDVEKRIYGHKNRRTYSKVGYSLNQYGVGAHVFEIIEECSAEILNERERYWQDYYKVMVPKIGLNSNLKYHPNGKVQLEKERKYWCNYSLIDYYYLDYNLNHENIDYLVEGVVEITDDSKNFFLNDIKINGTNISWWMHKDKKADINKIITEKINK